MISKHLIINIAFIFSLVAALVTLSLYVISIIYGATANAVGSVLTIIACDLIGLASIYTVMGNKEVEEQIILWENEPVLVSRGLPEVISYPFYLEGESVINGEISGKAGPFEFFLTGFFGTSEENVEMSRRFENDFVIRPKIFEKGTGSAQLKNTIGPITLPQGSYAFRFGKHAGIIDATFSLIKTVRKKPHENLYAVGLTLLEVGIPLLITGVISLGFGTFIS